jgi:molecular chaperone HscA
MLMKHRARPRTWRAASGQWRIEATHHPSLEAPSVDGEPAPRSGRHRQGIGLRDAMKTDTLAIKAWIESTDGASKAFAERRMNKHIARAMAGHRVDEFAGQARPSEEK